MCLLFFVKTTCFLFTMYFAIITVRTREKKDQKNRCLKFGNITVNVVRGQLTQQKVKYM